MRPAIIHPICVVWIQFDILYSHVRIIAFNIVKMQREIEIITESGQASHTDILTMKYNVKICADADRGHLQCYCGMYLADLGRPTNLDVQFIRVKIIELKYTFPAQILCWNEEF